MMSDIKKEIFFCVKAYKTGISTIYVVRVIQPFESIIHTWIYKAMIISE